jgi:O-antigen/teichoic acid export membrane protein
MSPLQRLIPRTEFARNVLMMMTGTTLAQIIPIAASPLLTRLFTPEQFGAFALFMGVASLVAIIATARFDLAIVLPESDAEAFQVASLSMGICVAVSLLALVVVGLFKDALVALFGGAVGSNWLYVVPVMVFLLGANQTLSGWANRKKQYGHLAANAITLHGVTAATTVGFGLATTPFNGLVGGRLIGQTLAGITLARKVFGRGTRIDARLDRAALHAVAVRYRQFPLLTVPYSFIGAFSREFLVFAFSSFQQIAAAGHFGFARTVLYAPMAFLSASLGQVFYKETADHFGTPRLERLVDRLMARIVDIFAPGFVLFVFWAPDLFEIVFGEKWRMSGLYAAVFAPAAFLYLFTSWPERLYVVAEKQQVPLLIQVACDAVSIVLVWSMLAAGASPLGCLAAYTGVAIVYHVTYLVGLYRVAGFSMASLWVLMRRIATIVAVLSATFAGLRFLPVHPMLQFILCALCLVTWYGRWLLREHRAAGQPPAA